MKFTILLLLIGAIQVSARAYSQPLSLNVQQVEIKKVLNSIEKKTSVRFLYNYDLGGLKKKVDLNVVDVDVLSALQKLLSGSGLSYKTLSNNLIAILAAGEPEQPQTKVSGRVADETNTPLQGVAVRVKGTNNGTLTDATGSFSLIAPSDAVLEITFVGYEDKEISLSGATMPLVVQLKASSKQLDQVVVIGYGTARKKDLTGAVSNIASKDFTDGNLSNPIQQIQGKVPGLSITVPGGDPNQQVAIRLRGQTSLTGGQTPLIVLDGVTLDDPSQIANIPAGDIASYDVLKDASATSIYGSRGANGVIVINTKRGKSGAPVIDYSGYVSADHIAKEYPMADAAQWKEGAAKAGLDAATIATFDHGANTNWQNALVRTGITNSHTLSLSGGGGGFTYRASVNYLNQEGIVLNSGREQVGLRFNVQQKAIHNKLELQAGVVNTQTSRKYADYNIFYEAYSSPPTYPVKNPDGSYFAYSDFALQNPVAQQVGETNTGKEYLTITYGSANYEIINGLKVGVTGSITHFNNQLAFYQPVFPVVNNLNVGAAGAENRNSSKGDFHLNYAKDWNKHNLTATAVYEYNDFIYNNQASVGQDFLLDQNQANNLQGGVQQYDRIYSYQEEYELISFLGRVTYNWNSRYYITGSIRRDGSSKFGADNRWGNFPAASVAWRLSQEDFMKDVSWINELKINAGFGVVGNQDAITPYNTQLTYAPVGNYYNGGSGTYAQAYAPNQNANPNLQWEERHGKNIGLDFTLFNSRLSGNFNLFDDKTEKLLYTYNVQYPNSSPSIVYPTILANVGDLTNKGEEFSLSWDVIRKKDFTWTAGGQMSFVRTKVTSLSGNYSNGEETFFVKTDNIPGGVAEGRGLSASPITYLKVGYSPYVFYIPHYEGLNSQGLETYDSAGGNTSNVNNATLHYTDPSPKFNYGFTSTFTYKNWSLNFFLRGVYGQKIFDNTRMVLDNVNRFAGNNGTVDALTNGITNSPQVSDHWLESASFLRMENATIGYTFHVTGIQALRVYVSTNNLFVLTHYRGLDPEVRNAPLNIPFLANYVATATGNSNLLANGGNKGTNGTAVPSPTEAYIDAAYQGDGFYPKTRSFTLGVNLTFK